MSSYSWFWFLNLIKVMRVTFNFLLFSTRWVEILKYRVFTTVIHSIKNNTAFLPFYLKHKIKMCGLSRLIFISSIYIFFFMIRFFFRQVYFWSKSNKGGIRIFICNYLSACHVIIDWSQRVLWVLIYTDIDWFSYFNIWIILPALTSWWLIPTNAVDGGWEYL